MAKTLLEQFRYNLKVIRICSKLCGCDVLNPKFRVNFITWIVISAIILYGFTNVYTVYMNLAANSEWSVFLQILCTTGSGVQGATKLFGGLAKKHHVIELMNEIDAIYEHYERKRDGYKFVLQKTVNLYTKVTQSIGATYGILCAALILSPVYILIVYNRKELILQFLVPGIDPSTEKGFYMLNIIHIMCLILACYGNFAGDMYFITLTTHMPLLKDILRCKFEDLNEVVENQNNNNGRKSMELLKDIFAWHQKYLRFIDLIKKSYFLVIIVQIITLSNSIGCTLFCLLLGEWPVGSLYLLYCFMMLYIYCGLGTLVEIANDGFIYSCYNDSLWYKYSVQEQKMLLLMLRLTQNTTGLTVGAVYPLSISTALQVTKTIYTFTMMLINFLD